MLWGFLYVVFNIYTVEARVHCWDPMASNWTPLGYSCPVNCNNVISAINRLKKMNYDTIMEPDASFENVVDSLENYIDTMTGDEYDLKKKTLRNTNTTQKQMLIDHTINKIQMAKKVQRRWNSESGICMKYYKAGDKKRFKKCLNRHTKFNVDKILVILSSALSRYSHANVTTNVTKKLMLKMLGPENLTVGKFNIKSVAKFLTHAFHAHKDINQNTRVITLTSQHCLTMHMPGCFCTKGNVERFGRCIKPKECYKGTLYDKYMSRIVIV